MELPKYTRDPVNNDERLVVYSAEHRGHANAQCAFTPGPVSRPLALKFWSSLFLARRQMMLGLEAGGVQSGC